MKSANEMELVALPGGRFAATASGIKLAEVWDSATRTHTHQLRGHTGKLRCVAALPGGLLAKGGEDKTARLWNAADGVHLKRHAGRVYSLAVLPDGRARKRLRRLHHSLVGCCDARLHRGAAARKQHMGCCRFKRRPPCE